MVFFDKECIVEANTVVVATTAGDGVFLGGAQAGYGFAGIEQAHLGVGDDIGVAFTDGCGARE